MDVDLHLAIGVVDAAAVTGAADSDDDIRAFFAERGGSWPALRDEDGSVYVSFGVSQVPETFVIDPDGVVRVRWAGPVDAITLSQLVQQQRDLYGAA